MRSLNFAKKVPLNFEIDIHKIQHLIDSWPIHRKVLNVVNCRFNLTFRSFVI